MKPRDVGVYIFLAIAWGFSFLLLVKAIHAFGWVGAVCFRGLIAAITLLAFSRLMTRKLELISKWRQLSVVGATTVAGQLVGLSLSTPRIGTAMSAILVAAIPLFSMFISRVWGLEKLKGSRLFGLFLGIIGLLVLVGFPVVAFTSEFLFGIFACICGCFCAAFGGVYASHVLKNVDPWEVATGAFISGSLMVLPLIVFVPIPTVPQPVDYLWLIILGSVMSATTYVLFFGLVASIGATKAVSVEFVVTVIAVIVGATVLGERLSILQWAGAGIVLVGCVLVLGLFPYSRRNENQPRP